MSRQLCWRLCAFGAQRTLARSASEITFARCHEDNPPSIPVVCELLEDDSCPARFATKVIGLARTVGLAASETRIAYNSCRNRHCPKCQGLARAQWLADRQSELLPVPYFHVVFTVPAPIAEIALHNKAVVYGILFTAAAETLRVIAADPRHLGAEIGLVAVLHTWGQNLHHHPHVHCVVPGGGLSADRSRWIGCRPGFFLPVKVLSRLYRRLFLTRLHAAFDAGQLRFFGDLVSLAAPAAFAA